MKTATIIFPHQLFKHHPALSKEREVFLVEEQLFFSGVQSSLQFHKKKLMLRRASMQVYKKRLESQGYRVHNIEFRMKVMIHQIDRMGKKRMEEHLAIGNRFLERL